uniref:Retrovirus-related Pol polyprotein from transposon TNT 1-94-like beta-barrel domain-containing protein n=1 Tax=Fagus sylvatica TaxID=28930 RepID=A0A2N9HPB4_FAGSY
MGSESEMATFKMMNQDFVKLDRFDGTNFTRWKDKLMFLLTALKIAYVLDPNLSKLPEPTDNDSDQLKAERKKREEDEVVCRGHILNTLSDRLYDLFTSMKSPKEIWEALEFKYKTEKQGADKFLIMKYFEFAMVDNISVMDQVHELQVMVNKLKDLKVVVAENLQVGAIIAKLPPSWNDYRKKLMHTTEDFTIEQIQKHLRIEEETRIRDKKINKKKQKKDHKVPNKANMVEENSDIVAMVSNLHISMVSELNMADAKSKSLDWWYDTGATVHVCNNKSHFKSLEDAMVGQQVQMGNNDTAKVEGKGTVELQFTSGKKLRKNLISANLLCKKGVKAVIESDNLILSKGGVFVGKGYSCDGIFKMKDLKEVDTILGIKVKKHSGGYALCQSHYIEKILLKFQYLRIKEVTTPYDSSVKLIENSGKVVAQLEYASAIGSLMYAMHGTRPDISFAVCKLSRYTNNPSTEHWKAIGRVLGYLKLTIGLGLYYTNFPLVLEGYTDASWITSASDNKATFGWVFTLGGGAVSWASKKQTCISHSTMESEFIALAAAGKEAEWLRNLLLDIKLWPQPMPAISLYCDSESTMSKAHSKVYNGKSRHISLRHEYVRQLIVDGIITIVFVRSSKNLADPFIKGLSRDLVKSTSSRMGLKPFV